MPLDRLVCVATDGASVLQSPVNAVIAKLREHPSNPSLFAQHCCTHCLVLAAKDARKGLPKHVEKTIDKVMNYFKGTLLEVCVQITQESVQIIPTLGIHHGVKVLHHCAAYEIPRDAFSVTPGWCINSRIREVFN